MASFCETGVLGTSFPLAKLIQLHLVVFVTATPRRTRPQNGTCKPSRGLGRRRRKPRSISKWREYSMPRRGKRPTEKPTNGGPTRKQYASSTGYTQAGVRSNRSNQWIIAIHYREEAAQS